MIRLAIIEGAMSEPLHSLAGRCIAELAAHPEFDVRRSPSVVGAPDADAYLVFGDSIDALAAELEDAAQRTPAKLTTTILMGVPPGFRPGSRDIVAGTAVELLERFRLGGSFAPQALVAWSDAPSWFTGSKDLMEGLGSNAFKAHQSPHYAAWFVAPGATLGDFLARYVRAAAAQND